MKNLDKRGEWKEDNLGKSKCTVLCSTCSKKVYTYPQAPNMLNPNSCVQQRISRKEPLHKLPRLFHLVHF